MKRQPPKVPRPTPVPRVRGPLDGLGAEEAAEFLAGPGLQQPVVEDLGDGTARFTFCLVAPEAEAVLLFANRLTDETDLPATLLHRVPGTEVFHASFRMETDWRASYAYLVHPRGGLAPWQVGDQVQIRQVLDRGLADPRNPVSCHNRAGVRQSVVEGPTAPAQPWLTPAPGTPRGTTTEEMLPDGRAVWLHDPAGIDPGTELPLLVMLDGEVWSGPHHSLPQMLDAMVAEGVLPPVRAVLPASGGREQRWQELAADGSGVQDLVEVVVPWVRARRGVLPGPEHLAVAGQSLGGLTALRAGLLRPDVVGGVLSHSASLWQDSLLDLVPDPAQAADPAAGPVARARIHLAHGRQEWVLTGPHQALAQALTEAGFDLQVAAHNGGHDYAWWRGGVADALVWLWGTQGAPALEA